MLFRIFNGSSFNTIHNQWKFKNKFHRTLYMIFPMDQQSKRSKMAAQNFFILTKFILYFLKNEISKVSLRNKRRKAVWNRNFLMCLLQN